MLSEVWGGYDSYFGSGGGVGRLKSCCGFWGDFFGSLWTLLCEAGEVSCTQSPASLTSLWLSLSHQSLSSRSCCSLNFSLLLNKRSSPEVPSFPLIWSSVIFIGQVSTPPYTKRSHVVSWYWMTSPLTLNPLIWLRCWMGGVGAWESRAGTEPITKWRKWMSCLWRNWKKEETSIKQINGIFCFV